MTKDDCEDETQEQRLCSLGGLSNNHGWAEAPLPFLLATACGMRIYGLAGP